MPKITTKADICDDQINYIEHPSMKSQIDPIERDKEEGESHVYRISHARNQSKGEESIPMREEVNPCVSSGVNSMKVVPSIGWLNQSHVQCHVEGKTMGNTMCQREPSTNLH